MTTTNSEDVYESEYKESPYLSNELVREMHKLQAKHLIESGKYRDDISPTTG